MLEIKYVFNCMELWGSFFAIVASIYLFIGKSAIRGQYKSLGRLELLAGIMLFFDAWAWYFDAVPGALNHSILQVSNYISFICNALIPVLLAEYVILSVDEEKRSKKVIIIVSVIAVCAVLFLAFSQISGFVYTINPETNEYKRGLGFVIWTVLVLLEANVVFVYTFLKKENMDKKRFGAIVSFIVIPIIATAIQLFVYGISLSNIAIILVALVMFAQALEDNAKMIVEQRERISNQEKQLQDLRTRIAISQIKPHFLYNALNSIYVLCDKDTDKAKEMVNSLSEYLRANIASIDADKPIPFEKELEHTKVYLEIEKARFKDRFNVAYDIQVTDFEIPALTVQPLVENAVKHGLCKRNYGAPGTVTIATVEDNGVVKVIISDNGTGFDLDEYNSRVRTEGEHIGLMNVKKRLEIMENARMEISSNIGQGTTVEITIPR
ncbi:sensor histidine kinase [Butyrivibrio sp. XBB1001]|uniref:sensor histidine kinase n=1 Tax=Butyrivibrio sp. XBB1001 TaxID=1280682 RepID=UPI000402F168|nr:histidine kinase [Butyrivibrio sp. XBB1001]